APPREHRDVGALLGERLGRCESEARRGPTDDRRPAAQPEIHSAREGSAWPGRREPPTKSPNGCLMRNSRTGSRRRQRRNVLGLTRRHVWKRGLPRAGNGLVCRPCEQNVTLSRNLV